MNVTDPRAFWLSAIGFKANRRRSLQPRTRLSSVDLKKLAGNDRVDIKDAARTHGFVYFLKCQSFIKVGYSSTPTERATKLNGSLPFDIELVGFIYGGTDLERSLHVLWKDHRHKGEWFNATPEMMADIHRILGK